MLIAGFVLFLFFASESLLESELDESLALEDEVAFFMDFLTTGFLLVFASASESLLDSLLELSLDSESASLLESLGSSTSICVLCHVGKSLSFLAAVFSPFCSRNVLTRPIKTSAVAGELVVRLVTAVLMELLAFLPPEDCLAAFLPAGMACGWVDASGSELV